MNKANRLTSLVSLVIFFAIAAYIGVYFIGSLLDPTQTSPAIMTTVADSGRMEGLIVREEIVIESALPYLDIQAQDGKRVFKGGTLAVSYGAETGLAQAERIRTLRIKIAQAESWLKHSQGDAALDTETALRSAILSMSRAVARRETEDLDALALNLSSLLFDSDGSQLSREEIDALKTELRALETSVPQGGTTPILAESSGLFSTMLDGYEGISPDMLRELSPSLVASLVGLRQKISENAIGKLVTSQIWYFAARMSAGDGEQLSVGDRVEANFGRYLDAPVTLLVESVSAEEGGERAVLFSCGQSLSATLANREVTAEIKFTEHRGLRVPREALRVDEDDNIYVFVYTVMYAEKKIVNIVYEGDGFVLVSEDSDPSALREGNEIIVKGRGLYDGKVMG